MLHSIVYEIVHYRDARGAYPFREWFEGLRDQQARSRIAMRLYRLEDGNLGDVKPVGEGVLELRVPVGAGHRVYCARHGNRLVVLLCGGDKSTQTNDIELAKQYWHDWKRGTS